VTPQSPSPIEEVRSALDEAIEVLGEEIEQAAALIRRAQGLRAGLDRGWPYRHTAGDGHALVSPLVAERAKVLRMLSSRLQQAEARALRAEGMSVGAVGRSLGVSRQRASIILRDSPAADAPEEEE
jgi:hypothetical protein